MNNRYQPTTEMAARGIRPDPDLVEAIAVRVVELIGDGVRREASARLIDANALAHELGVERDWVYAHANDLGAIRLGGPRGRLRFDLEVVKERLGGSNAASWRAPRPAPRRPSARRRKVARTPLERKLKSSSLQKAAGARANAPGLTPGGNPDAAQR